MPGAKLQSKFPSLVVFLAVNFRKFLKISKRLTLRLVTLALYKKSRYSANEVCFNFVEF